MTISPSLLLRWLALAVCAFLTVAATAAAQESDPAEQTTSAGPGEEGNSGGGTGGESAKPKYPPFADVVKDMQPVPDPSLIKLYRKDARLLAEISGGQLNRDFIVLISIARGIGERPILGGMSWGFGDDLLWQFRKVDDSIQIVRRNVRFTARPGSPESNAVRLAYTDSILFSLPILTTSPRGGFVIDLTPVLLSDLPQISSVMPGFSFAANRSTFASVKGFEGNVEVEVAATYAAGGMFAPQFDTVPDSRGVTINVHYSISLLPETGYRPRLADDRVGYFLTVIKDYSKQPEEDRFVRYINRWHLEKADPSAEMSPPKKPIIFYLEKTIPFQYRKPIEDGILEWNRAFEKVGYVNAIRVIQQRDGDTWDPEDINYNTFRWITASAGFAMGPSRVNPLTGQILDADIIFDADFIQYWKAEYETFTPASIAAMTGGPLDLKSYQEHLDSLPPHHRGHADCSCEYHSGMGRELALGAASLYWRYGADGNKGLEEKMLAQGLKEVTMHEVGHTLGLRHNFKASTMLSLADLNDPEKTRDVGLTGSVMDYAPANLVPKGTPQGDFFSGTIGPYDMWAIEYGYKPLSAGSPEGELPELQKIAARCAEPELTFATDEDTRGIDSDPLSNRYDLGSDPLEYAIQRTTLVGEMWPDVIDKVTKEGDGYQKARRAFGVLLGDYGRSVFFASRFIGGLYVHRDHKGDPDARPPFVVVPAEKQREALALIEARVLSDQPFQFPPELYNHLASSRWSHWGQGSPSRLDYAVHEVIAMWQDRVLQQLLSSLTLTRLHDAELKVPADEDVFTSAELIERLTGSVFGEVNQLASGELTGEFTTRQPAISSLRRNLQRIYVRRLANIALGSSGAPDDCQTVAFITLEDLARRIDNVLAGQTNLDTYTRAHLRETSSRIHKVLEANIQLARP